MPSPKFEPDLLCYSSSSDDEGKTYFVFWLVSSQVLGVTDLSDDLFEIELDRKERTRFLKHTAESLVDNKWRNTFSEKGLKLQGVGEDAVTLRYITKDLEVPRVTSGQKRRERNVEMVKMMVEEKGKMMALNAQPAQKEAGEAGTTVTAKTGGGVVEKNRRKRAKPGGPQFGDDDGEEEE